MVIRSLIASVVALGFAGAVSAVTVDLDAATQGAGDKGSSYEVNGDVTLNSSKVKRRRARRANAVGNPTSIVVTDDGTGVAGPGRRNTSGINRGESLEVAFNGPTSSDSVSFDVSNIQSGRRGDKAIVMVNVVGGSSPVVVAAKQVAQAFRALGGESGTVALADLIGGGQQIESFVIKGVKGSFHVSSLSYDSPSSGSQAANPEPVTASLVLLGGAALGYATRRRRNELAE